MSDAQKTPLAQTLTAFAQTKIIDAYQLLGKGLPASVVSVSGAIVTVKFEIASDYTLPQVTIPLFGPEYARYPIKAGDKGVVIPFDAHLGGMSGLGGGVAGLTQPANLSALVFLPIANTAWVSVDPNAVTLYGPNGVVLRDTGSGAVITLTPTGINCQVGASVFNITAGATTLTTPTFTVNGATVLNGPLSQGTGSGGGTATMLGPITVTNDVVAEGKSLGTHHHGGVTTGSGNTGGPV